MNISMYYKNEPVQTRPGR